MNDLKKAQKTVSAEFGNPISPESFDALQREIAETENNLEQLMNKSEKFGSVFAQQAAAIGKSFEEQGQKISNFGQKMVKVTEGVAAAGAAAVVTADNVDQAADSYTMTTGTSAGSERISDVYSGGFGESLDDVATSMAAVRTVLGEMDSDALQELTENAITFRDAFGPDVPEQMLAVNSLIDQFGLSAGQAYALLVQGAQKGLNQNGDLLDVVTEYSVQFRTAGYSAQDMFNMLSNGVQTGTWSVDKLGDAVKEFNIRMSDGSAQEAVEALGFSWESVSKTWSQGGEDAREVFNMLITKLDGLERSTEGYSVGVALLGTMYEDLGQDAVLALSNVKGGITTSSAAMDELTQKRLDNLGEQAQSLGRTFMTDVAAPIGERLIPVVSDVIDKVSVWIEKFSNLTPEGQNVILTIAGIAAGIGPLLLLIGHVITGVGNITSAVGKVMQALPQLQTTFSKVFGFIQTHPIVLLLAAVILFGDQIQAIFQKIDNFMQGVFAKDWTDVFGPVLGGVLNGFFLTVQGIWDSIMQLLNGVIDFVRGVFTGNWERAWNGVAQIFEGVANGLLAIAAVPINGIIGLLNGLISGVNLAIDAINGLFGLSLSRWNLLELFDPSSVSTAVEAAQGAVSGASSSSHNGSGIGRMTSEIAAMPMLAAGGEVFSGSAIVGDGGMELLTVANGRAIVQPLNNTTNHHTALGGVNIAIYAQPGQNEQEIADIVMERMQAACDRKGAGL